MGDMIVCDSLGAELTSDLFFCDKTQSSLVEETPGEGIYEN